MKIFFFPHIFLCIMQKIKRKQSILDAGERSRLCCGFGRLGDEGGVEVYLSAAVFVLIAITHSSPQDFKTVHNNSLPASYSARN